MRLVNTVIALGRSREPMRKAYSVLPATNDKARACGLCFMTGLFRGAPLQTLAYLATVSSICVMSGRAISAARVVSGRGDKAAM